MAALNLFDVNGKSRRKMERQGAPGPLMVGKDSYKIRKPTGSTSKPVVIYVVPPKVIHAEASEFMALVQRLTGSDSPTSPTAVRDAKTSASGKGSDDDGSSVQYGVGPGISPPTLSLHEWNPRSHRGHHHDEDGRSSFQFLKGGGRGGGRSPAGDYVDESSSSFRPSNPVAVAAPCSPYFDVFSRKEKDQEF